MIDNRLMNDNAPAENRGPDRLDGRITRVPFGLPPVAAPAAAPAAEGLFAILWRSRWLILICVVVALAVGIAYIQTATAIYKSTARLYLDYTALRISNPYDAGGRPQTDKYLYTQVELIQSTPNIAAAAETLIPQQLRTFAQVDIPTAYLQKHVAVDVGRKDEVISVAFRSPYPVEAAAIVNCVVDAYMASRSERDRKSASDVLKTLTNSKTLTTKELEAKQDELARFQETQMPLSLGSDQGGAVMQGLLLLKNELTQAQIRRVEAEAFLVGTRALAKTPAALRQYVRTRGNVGAYAALVEQTPLENRAVELELERETLSETFTLDHPRTARLTAELGQIDSKRQELDRRFVTATLASAEQQFEEAKRHEEEIAALYAEQQAEVRNANMEIRKYEQLQSEADRLTAYFKTLDEQVREIRKIVGEDVGQLRMAILEPALPAETPCEPRRARAMATALVLGLLVGGGIAVLKDSLDQTLRSTDEVSALLGLPVLGVIPPMPRRQRVHERGRKVLLEPDSHEAEAFRTVRTAVFFGAAKDGAKTMLVTSPMAGEGKSTLVSNLGIAIAHAGQKTLILDADMRRPAQHLIFQVDASQRSLSSVFAGRVKLGAAILPTGVKDLHLLAHGHAVSNPAEILNSPRFGCLLRRLAEVYDRIIIDAPPVTIVTDAQIVAALCDVTILVLRADKSTKGMAQRAVDALGRVHARLLGVVVNEVCKAGDRYGGYYGRYSRYYGSGSRNGGKSKVKGEVMVGSGARDSGPDMISERDDSVRAR
jgi:capsular exopolysaccharide synthesis family protein